MKGTPKQRLRGLLDGLPLDKEDRKAIENLLERTTEEEVAEFVDAIEEARREDPDFVQNFIDAFREAARNGELDPDRDD